MEFKISIAPNSSVPIYRQIVENVRRAVAVGSIQEGKQLPSVRVLAEELVVNANTVARAYAELVREGVAYAQAGRGLFISKRRQIYSEEERRRRLQEAGEVFLHEAYFLGFTQPEIQEFINQKWPKLKGEEK